MAEELENTRKPKVELIKHAAVAVKSEEAPRADERRKVVVVKKKPPAPGAVRKPQPRVVVQAQEKGEGGEKKTKPQEFVPPTQRPTGAAGRVGGRPVGRQDDGRPRTGRPEGYQGYQGRPEGAPFAQRPAGAAGRVGGRYVGHGPGQGPNRGPGAGGPAGGQRPPFNRYPRPGGGTGPGTGFRPGGRPGAKPGFGGGEAPPPVDGKGPVKRSFKAKKTVYQRKEQEMEEKLLQTKKKITQTANPVPKSIDIMEVVSVSELARKMNLKASDLIQKLMSMGMMVTINQQIDAETATLLAAEFGAEVKIVSLYDETLIDTGTDDAADMEARPPVVTVMGHVDHGKTKLLDAIRSADVVSGEAGGITQHIGAYMVETPRGRIAFLDTPGHEAFTRMRARGAQVTDIVILVVAADDGVMPQTIEAINHAKEAEVPIIVAVNKIDKPEANPDRVKSQLSELGLMPEDWGGQTMFVELSALKKEGIDKLIDAILLEAEILDLKASYNRTAEGKVLESRIDHGRGVVATVMIEKGTLKVGDSFVAGIWPGKVRALFNDKGEKVEVATPSMPVEVLGFEGIPNAGDPLQVVEDERNARGVSAKRQEL
ncbi:MAG: translation initiation factor IF-2, partial [Treponema sp.]|nr:translation initiation factor IF-2 [Treponema sp.]